MVFCASYVHENVVLLALQQNGPLLVYCDSDAVVEAFLAKPRAAFLIVKVLTAFLAAAHTAEAILHLHVALMAEEAILLQLVLVAAGAVGVYIHKFAGEAVPLATVLAPFGALPLLLAQLTLRRLVHFVRVLESAPT